MTADLMSVVMAILVCLDVEWWRHPTDPLRNIVIAYGLRLDTGEENGTCSIIIYPSGPDKRQRLTLGGLLTRLFAKALADNIITSIPEKVTLLNALRPGRYLRLPGLPAAQAADRCLKGGFRHHPWQHQDHHRRRNGLPGGRAPSRPGPSPNEDCRFDRHRW